MIISPTQWIIFSFSRLVVVNILLKRQYLTQKNYTFFAYFKCCIVGVTSTHCFGMNLYTKTENRWLSKWYNCCTLVLILQTKNHEWMNERRRVGYAVPSCVRRNAEQHYIKCRWEWFSAMVLTFLHKSNIVCCNSLRCSWFNMLITGVLLTTQKITPTGTNSSFIH